MTPHKSHGQPRPAAPANVYHIDEAELGTALIAQGRMQGIATMVRSTLCTEGFEPPLLPEVALRLMRLANQPEVDIREVEGAVVQDPVVAARIVSVANSVLYSRGAPINSLRNCISRLGLSVVRDIAFQVVAQTKIFRVPGYAERARAIAETAQASGYISREICKILCFESELAYLCGLCHDMGEAILLGIVADGTRAKKEPIPSLEELEPALQAYHAATGAGIARLWKLPEIIVDAVLHHHNPLRSTDPSQMATVVACSDVLLAHAGIGCLQKRIGPMDNPIFYSLNLGPLQVESLLGFADAMAADRSFWAMSA